jgi:hypothetical protein
MESRPDEHAIKRRKFRKGTHSCQECRRRKVKCVFSTPDSTTCVVCLRRGVHCLSQADSSILAIVDGAAANASSVSMPTVLAATAGPRSGVLAHQPSSTRISREGLSTLPATSTDQSQHMAAGVAIGDVPTMMLRRHASAESAEVDQEFHARDVAATLVTPTSASFEAGQSERGNAQNALPQAAAMPNPPIMPNDVSPPFPAASFDDLVMNTLLHQSDVPRLDEVGTGSWDISIFP